MSTSFSHIARKTVKVAKAFLSRSQLLLQSQSLSLSLTLPLLLCLCAVTAHADTPEGTLTLPRTGADAVSLPSVEASSLARHADHPINYSTGTATVNFTLYTIKAGEVTIPVTLSTSTGAVRVDDEEGPVGLGWDLGYGGCISRSIAGLPDSLTQQNIAAAYEQDSVALKNIYERCIDGDYDRYTWKAGDQSGTFIIQGATIVQLPQTDATIKRTAAGFTVTLPDGTEYEYGSPEQVVYTYTPDIQDIYGHSVNYTADCMWRLQKVTGPTGTDEVTFTYTDIADKVKGVDGRPSSVSVTCEDAPESTPSGMGGTTSGSHPSQDTTVHRYLYTHRKMLSGIDWNGGHLSVTPSQDRIASMEVTANDATHTRARKIEFTYGREMPRKTGTAKMLTAFTITCDGEVLDGAEFGYNAPASVHKDMFGFNNDGYENREPLPQELTGVSHTQGNAAGFYTGVSDGFIAGQEGLGGDGATLTEQQRQTIAEHSYLVDPRESILAITAAGVRPNPARVPYSPISHNGGVYAGALRSIRTIAGSETVFEYEPAWYTADTTAVSGDFIGIRLKSEHVTDISTGAWRHRELSYANPVTSVPVELSDLNNFVSVSGAIITSAMGGLMMSRTLTTGVSMLTSSRKPGASVESACVFYGKVTDVITGSELPRSVVTTYEYDLSSAVAQGAAGEHQVNIDYTSNCRYSGTVITGAYNINQSFQQALIPLLAPKTVNTYYRESFGERAPLSRVIRWEWREHGSTAVLDTLSVTEHYYSRGSVSTVDMGYYVDPIVRSISPWGGHAGPGYSHPSDFCRFRVRADRYRHYLDRTVTREYDKSGTCHSVETRYTYHNHNAHSLLGIDGYVHPTGSDGLLCRTTTVCLSDPSAKAFEQTIRYASSSGSGIPSTVSTKRRSMPVSVTFAHGASTHVRQRYAYSTTLCPLNNAYRLSALVTEYTGADNIYRQIDSIAVLGYDSHGNPSAVRRNGGVPVAYTWDGAHRVLSSAVGTIDGTTPYDGTITPLVTTYTYTGLFGLSGVTSPAHTEATYAYQGGRLWRQWLAGDIINTYSYSLPHQGQLGFVSVTHASLGVNAAGASETVWYDAMGNAAVKALTPQGTVVSRGAALSQGYGSVASYDILGRSLRGYMPAPLSGVDASDLQQVTAHTMQHYTSDNRPYTETAYAASADSRPVSATLAGEEYTGHPATTEYLYNTGNSGNGSNGGNGSNNNILSCHRYTGTYTSLTNSGYYPPGALSVTKVTDGDGRVSLTFTDYRGRTVLTRGILTEGGAQTFIDTYTVYDDADNVVAVLPPRASERFSTVGATWQISTDAVLRDSVYRYSYDNRLRLVEKKMPGADAVIFRYDATGALVLTQDGNQRQRGAASFVAPDALGRVALTGECDLTYNLVSAMEGCMVKATFNVSSSDQTGYTLNVPMTSAKVFTANYYDDYSFLNLSVYSPLKTKITAASVSPSRQSSAGLLTGTYVANLGNPSQASLGAGFEGPIALTDAQILSMGGILSRTLSASYYDKRERADVTAVYDHLGGFTLTRTAYSNTDAVTSTAVTRTPYNSSSQDAVSFAYTYDSYGRKVDTRMTRSGVTTLLQHNIYNNIGQVTTSQYGNGQGTGYSYTTSGAISAMASGPSSASTFVQTFNYATGPTPSYSGNIGSMHWHGADNVVRGYNYSYDGLNRLVSASYYELGSRPAQFVITGGNTPSYSTMYVYDHDSNPLKIIRNGVTDMLATASMVQLEFGQIDNLSLRYNGTQLKAVEDNAQSIVYAGASDFDDGAHTTVEYTYDANGNTLSDANRGIETIVYNAIGLPYSITLADGSKITNTYDANGVLLRRVTTTPSRLPGLPGNVGLGHTITTTEDRIGLYTYTGNTLSRIDTPVGYIDGNDSIRYYITDYQGNIRQVVNPDGEVLQDNHYYPFGMLMGESSDIVAANLPLGHFTDGGGNRFRYGAKELITTGGVNLSDYTARFLDHATLRFLTPDPLREKYTSTSSYLYCGANPVMFIDPTGRTLRLIGSKEDVQKTVDLYEECMGGKVSLSVNDEGYVTIDKADYDVSTLSDEVKFGITTITEIIDDNRCTTLQIVSNSSDILIGDAEQQTIDIADIQSLGEGECVNAMSALFHETVEQYNIQAVGCNTTDAHYKATRAEGALTKSNHPRVKLIVGLKEEKQSISFNVTRNYSLFTEDRKTFNITIRAINNNGLTISRTLLD